MAATVARAVDACLVAAFAGANAALDPGSPDRISTYRVMIPGVPTNRYAVIFAGGPSRTAGEGLGPSRDGVGSFQVTVAATAADRARAADLCDRMVEATLDALVDTQLTVDGWAPFIVQQDPVPTYPVPVEVVSGRATVEQALLFTFLTDKL